jgi:hypothetical protein
MHQQQEQAAQGKSVQGDFNLDPYEDYYEEEAF